MYAWSVYILSILHKPVTGQELFLAVSYSKSVLVAFLKILKKNTLFCRETNNTLYDSPNSWGWGIVRSKFEYTLKSNEYFLIKYLGYIIKSTRTHRYSCILWLWWSRSRTGEHSDSSGQIQKIKGQCYLDWKVQWLNCALIIHF